MTDLADMQNMKVALCAEVCIGFGQIIRKIIDKA